MTSVSDRTVVYLEFFHRWDTPLDDRAIQFMRSIVRQAPDYEMFQALVPAESAERTLFERSFGSFEDAGRLIRQGLMNEDLFFDAWYGMPGTWNRAKPYVHYLRQESNNPQLYEDFEWLAQRAGEFWAERESHPPIWRPLTSAQPTEDDLKIFEAFQRIWSTSRDTTAREFFAELEQQRPSVDEFMARVSVGSEAFVVFDRFLCTYDQAGTLVKNGIVHPRLFFQHWPAPGVIWDVTEPWILALRHARNEPHLYDGLDWLVGYEREQAVSTDVAHDA